MRQGERGGRGGKETPGIALQTAASYTRALKKLDHGHQNQQLFLIRPRALYFFDVYIQRQAQAFHSWNKYNSAAEGCKPKLRETETAQYNVKNMRHARVLTPEP